MLNKNVGNTIIFVDLMNNSELASTKRTCIIYDKNSTENQTHPFWRHDATASCSHEETPGKNLLKL
jgi:hypothetical protein